MRHARLGRAFALRFGLMGIAKYITSSGARSVEARALSVRVACCEPATADHGTLPFACFNFTRYIIESRARGHRLDILWLRRPTPKSCGIQDPEKLTYAMRASHGTSQDNLYCSGELYRKTQVSGTPIHTRLRNSGHGESFPPSTSFHSYNHEHSSTTCPIFSPEKPEDR